MKVVLLTQQQADELKGLEVVSDNLFNPIKDADNNWIISTEEQKQCSIEWVKNCPLIDFKPVQITFP